MKITTIIAGIIIAFLAIIMLSWLGIDITRLLSYVIPIAVGAYLLILAKRYVDTKAQESKISTDLSAKIILLNESLDRIEKKVDRIDKILEKVSE